MDIRNRSRGGDALKLTGRIREERAILQLALGVLW